MIIGSLVWLVGWFAAYATLSRFALIYITNKKWDGTDRACCSALSLFSWILVIIIGLFYFGKMMVPLLIWLEPKGCKDE